MKHDIAACFPCRVGWLDLISRLDSAVLNRNEGNSNACQFGCLVGDFMGKLHAFLICVYRKLFSLLKTEHSVYDVVCIPVSKISHLKRPLKAEYKIKTP